MDGVTQEDMLAASAELLSQGYTIEEILQASADLSVMVSPSKPSDEVPVYTVEQLATASKQLLEQGYTAEEIAAASEDVVSESLQCEPIKLFSTSSSLSGFTLEELDAATEELIEQGFSAKEIAALRQELLMARAEVRALLEESVGDSEGTIIVPAPSRTEDREKPFAEECSSASSAGVQESAVVPDPVAKENSANLAMESCAESEAPSSKKRKATSEPEEKPQLRRFICL